MKISGIIIDPLAGRIEKGIITVLNGKISSVEWGVGEGGDYIMPGLVDAHVHIESSMLTPRTFGGEILRHGTVAAVCDPHEIANVMGVKGVEYMIKEGSGSKVKFLFGVPSCVPATPFESSGGTITPDDVERLLESGEASFLGEVMNFPGVIAGEPGLMRMIGTAKRLGKPIDGHAPMLTGDSLSRYAEAGIGTDHECSTIEEALEKIALGMKILIREGSAAKNYELLQPLISSHNNVVMFCTDDMHPANIKDGHINAIVARAVRDGHSIIDVVRVASLNPSRHYNIEMGLLQPGDPADFIVVDNPASMHVKQTWINGEMVYGTGVKAEALYRPELVNNFNSQPVDVAQLSVRRVGKNYRVITVTDGSLLTGEAIEDSGSGEYIIPGSGSGINKIVVKERYNNGVPAVGFVKGLGIEMGAIASSVAHDSHNIVAAGGSDNDIAAAINLVTDSKGGLAVVFGDQKLILPLPVAGLMSDRSREEVAADYEKLISVTLKMGCTLKSPFMTMAFMSLLVIPELKIGDRGLFSVSSFAPVPLQF